MLLFVLAAILSDSEATGDQLVIGSFVVSRAFDSSVHVQILPEAYKQGLNLCIVRAVYYMYNNLRAQIKIPSSPTESVVVRDRKGVRQGSARSLYSTGTLLVRQTEAKIWTAHGSVIGNRHRFCRRYLVLLYNAITLPRVVYIAPFWKYLSSTQCTKSTFLEIFVVHPVYKSKSSVFSIREVPSETSSVDEELVYHAQLQSVQSNSLH